MFTGIINGQGKLLAVESRGHETRFRIQALYDLADIILGESIAVNGTCLTVETSGPSLFSAYASAETMQRTALGLLKPGAKVNLERALAVGDRLGGHIVSGTWTVWLKSCPCGGKASRGASASVFPLLSERKSSGRAQWHLTASA